MSLKPLKVSEQKKNQESKNFCTGYGQKYKGFAEVCKNTG